MFTEYTHVRHGGNIGLGPVYIERAYTRADVEDGGLDDFHGGTAFPHGHVQRGLDGSNSGARASGCIDVCVGRQRRSGTRFTRVQRMPVADLWPTLPTQGRENMKWALEHSSIPKKKKLLQRLNITPQMPCIV